MVCIRRASFQLLAFLFFTGYSLSLFSQTVSIDAFRAYSDSTVLVAAHRGDWRNHPENSLSGIQSCIDKGIDIVEIDVCMTKDSNFILMHDATINRTTNGRGRVKDYTLETLQSFKLKGKGGVLTEETIPSLEEAILLAKGKILLNLDKSVLWMDELLAVVDSLDARQTIILKGGLTAGFFSEHIANNPDGPLYMPIMHYMDIAKTDTFLSRSHAELAEMILGTDTSYICREEGKALFARRHCRLWYNALYRSLACGYGENKSTIFTWEFLISRGAFVIQTDYPFQLMQYLIDHGFHKRPDGWVDVDYSKLPNEPPDTNQIRQQNNNGNNTDQYSGNAVYHTIRSGDTLWALSKKYHTSVDAICRLNSNLTSKTVLKIGRKIRVR